MKFRKPKPKQSVMKLKTNQFKVISEMAAKAQQLAEQFKAAKAQLSLYVTSAGHAYSKCIPDTYTNWRLDLKNRLVIFTPPPEPPKVVPGLTPTPEGPKLEK